MSSGGVGQADGRLRLHRRHSHRLSDREVESWQEEETKKLAERLQQELDLLSAFQSKQRKQDGDCPGGRARAALRTRRSPLRRPRAAHGRRGRRARLRTTAALAGPRQSAPATLDSFHEESSRKGFSLAQLSPDSVSLHSLSLSPSLASASPSVCPSASPSDDPTSSAASTPVQ